MFQRSKFSISNQNIFFFLNVLNILVNFWQVLLSAVAEVSLNPHRTYSLEDGEVGAIIFIAGSFLCEPGLRLEGLQVNSSFLWDQ